VRGEVKSYKVKRKKLKIFLAPVPSETAGFGVERFANLNKVVGVELR